jgi:hypothetical protein
MKIMLALCALLFSLATQANTPWLKKPVLYFYQDNTILAQRIGTDEDITNKAQQVYDAFVKNTASIKKTENEQPFYFVIVFNDKGAVKSWIQSEDKERREVLESTAKKVLKEVQFKSLSGSTAIAFYFGIEGLTKSLETKPPILEEWDEIIEKSKKITASDLFDQLLAVSNK